MTYDQLLQDVEILGDMVFEMENEKMLSKKQSDMFFKFFREVFNYIDEQNRVLNSVAETLVE